MTGSEWGAGDAPALAPPAGPAAGAPLRVAHALTREAQLLVVQLRFQLAHAAVLRMGGEG
jgi:hypothetical protein